MRHRVIISLGILLTAGCVNPSVQPEAPPWHTATDAAKYVRWWAKNIDSRSDGKLYERALVGNSAALKEILHDPHNNHGPADQEGDASFVLAGAFIVVLGDTIFSEFVQSQKPEVQRFVFGGLTYGPWQHTESELAQRYPSTNSLRQKFEQVVAPNRSLPSTLNSTSSVRGPEDF